MFRAELVFSTETLRAERARVVWISLECALSLIDAAEFVFSHGAHLYNFLLGFLAFSSRFRSLGLFREGYSWNVLARRVLLPMAENDFFSIYVDLRISVGDAPSFFG